MTGWLGISLLCVEVVIVCSQTIRYAEKRVINSPGVDFATYQQQLATLPPSPGLSAYSEYSQKMPEPTSFSGELPKNIRTIILTKRVPVPYPVHVEKKIPFPVKFPIRRPYTVYVPRPYVVEVMKQVPVPVKIPFPQPYTFEKHVAVPYKVHYDKPYPLHIAKPFPVYYEKRIPIHIEKPVPVPYKVAFDRPVPVQLPVEKQVLYAVEPPWPFPVKVPVEKPVISHQEKPTPVTVEKPQLPTGPPHHTEQSLTESYYSTTQPPTHNTFSPSQYDELTSSLITQGKHKAISFLPGSQNNLSPYGEHSELHPIHVANFKASGGNSTDWVPKPYVTNNQYLSYIPSTQPTHIQYVPPTTKTVDGNTDSAHPNSIKMHYKLHYDPVKQEYSFQLVPKATGTYSGAHVGYSYQSISSEGKQAPSAPTGPPSDYVYQRETQNEGELQDSSKDNPNEETRFRYQQILNEKDQGYQNSAGPQALTYSFPAQEEQFKQEEPQTYETVNTANSLSFEGGRQVDQHQQITYTYEPVQNAPQEMTSQQLGNGQHQVSYSYQAIGNDAKANFQMSDQLKPNQVSYVYVPQEPAGESYSEATSNANLVPTYSVSHDQNEFNTEYSPLLYQRGKVSSNLRDRYVTEQPLLGSIPEHFKSSRKSERALLHEVVTVNRSSPITNHKQRDYDSSRTKYHVMNVHPSPLNQTADAGSATSSITFQKFGVDDVMSRRRTRLYPVNSVPLTKKLDTSATNNDLIVGNYFQAPDSTTPTTEITSTPKAYRRSLYQSPIRRAQEPAVNVEEATTEETNTGSYYEGGNRWFEFFGLDNSENQETTDISKDTNSHTGAAERVPFTYKPTPPATTTTSSLLPPEDLTTAKPTESITIRTRGSVRAYGRLKEAEPTTEGYLPNSTTKGTKRRRRPGRRRVDKVTEAPAQETEA